MRPRGDHEDPLEHRKTQTPFLSALEDMGAAAYIHLQKPILLLHLGVGCGGFRAGRVSVGTLFFCLDVGSGAQKLNYFLALRRNPFLSRQKVYFNGGVA